MDARIETVVRMLERDPATSIPSLARVVGLSLSRLEHLFKHETDRQLNDFRNGRRIQLTVDLLQTTDKPIKEIAWLLGYRHPSNFNRTFQRRLGITPGRYRRNQKKIPR